MITSDAGLSSTTMSVSIQKLPPEIFPSILSYLDRPSLFAVLTTARFLHPHAEYLLYRRVDFREGPVSNTQTIGFLVSVVQNPRLGSLVSSFYADVVNHQMDIPSTSKLSVDLLPYAMKFFPNLKSIALSQFSLNGMIPECLRWPPNQAPPFQLERLALEIRRPRGFQFAEHLLQLLQHQPALRHLSLIFSMPSIWSDPLLGTTPADPEDICPSLEMLEGTNSVIQLLLPKRRIKSLFWECTRPYRGEPLCSADLEEDSHFRDSFFTPGLCEAYGHLENLVMYDQIWFIFILSTYLKSLKTLLLSISVTLQSEKPHWDEGAFLRAVGEMENLEVLVVTFLQESDVGLDPKVVFAASRSLKYFAFTINGRKRSLDRAVFMERRADGAIYPVGQGIFDDIPYLHNGWFTFQTEDGSDTSAFVT